MQQKNTGPQHNNTALEWIGRTYNLATTAFEKSTGVTAARWRLLLLIHRHKSCTQKQLIAEIRVDPAAVTRQVKVLEAEGLIQRDSDAQDSRLTRVVLSPSGATYVKRVLAARKAFLDRMLQGVAAEDLATLTRVLEQLCTNLDDDSILP